MNPVTHFLAGWVIGSDPSLSNHDRALVIIASVSPDVDALPILIDFAKGRSTDSLELWSRFHHSLHNVTFAVAFALVCLMITNRRYMTATLAFFAINLHYFCDIIGSRGPDGYQWPIPYLMPFSDSWQLTVPWQWPLNAWPNVLITAMLIMFTLYVAWSRGYSPVGMISARGDQVFVATLRQRFGFPRRTNER